MSSSGQLQAVSPSASASASASTGPTKHYYYVMYDARLDRALCAPALCTIDWKQAYAVPKAERYAFLERIADAYGFNPKESSDLITALLPRFESLPTPQHCLLLQLHAHVLHHNNSQPISAAHTASTTSAASAATTAAAAKPQSSGTASSSAVSAASSGGVWPAESILTLSPPPTTSIRLLVVSGRLPPGVTPGQAQALCGAPPLPATPPPRHAGLVLVEWGLLHLDPAQATANSALHIA